MSNLQVLALNGTQITDAGLVHLQNLIALEELHLSWTEIIDVGLVYLHKLKNLRSLDLDYTKVSDAGIAAVKQALPDCRIDWKPKA